MIYKKEQFNNCALNPFAVEDELTRYIICLYDPASPLIRGEQNLNTRKEVASEISKAKVDESDEAYIEAVQNYLRNYAKSMEWAILVGLEETFWEYMSRLRQPITDEKDTDSMRATAAKTQLAKDAKSILDMYKTERSIFYGDDATLIKNIGKIRRSTPENIGKIG